MKGLIDMSKAFPIKDFPGYYVTDTGDVYSRKIDGRFRKLKPQKHSNGYIFVTLSKDKEAKQKSIHRLVAEVFIPNPEKKLQINHKNGIKTDNRVENLEWCSASENLKHSYRVLGNKGSMFGKHGKTCPLSKIVLQIKKGKVVTEFYGCVEASQITGISKSRITGCCLGYYGYKTAGGYQWKYK